MNSIQDHSRCIIHVDIDCFYAQVEIVKHPEIANRPVGIKQKHIVVTSNYVARKYGVKKCMSIDEAYRLCPALLLINGEDLHDYRNISYEVTNHLHQYTPLVERLGLDENFLDVTELVRQRRTSFTDFKSVGHVFGEETELCQCSCLENLIVASHIAQEIRDGLYEKFKLTTCAGIAHNKLLAKIVGGKHKPNQQTTVFPNSALELMLSLDDVQNIPGLGAVTCKTLKSEGIVRVEQIHNNFAKLESLFGVEKANFITALSYGRDATPVKTSEKPQSIGIEDSCKLSSAETEIRNKFSQLLKRLMILVSEDGRLPTTLKVTIRKSDNCTKSSHRETRQCNISSSLFTADKTSKAVTLSEQSENKLMSIIMHLFNKLADTTKSYHVTLLGLSFTKFKESASGKNSIASYFVKDVSVQSPTNISNKQEAQGNSRTSSANLSSELNESDTEPTAKRPKFFSTDKFRDCSPSKLSIANLDLNSKSGESVQKNGSDNEIYCPPNVDKSVFKELPVTLQKELWSEWKNQREENCRKKARIDKPNTLLNYFCRH